MSKVEQKLEQKRRQRRPSPGLEARAALSPKEACDYLCIGLTTLYFEMQSGRLPFRKLGRKTIIRRLDADQWLDDLPSTGLIGYGRKPEPQPESEPEPVW